MTLIASTFISSTRIETKSTFILLVIWFVWFWFVHAFLQEAKKRETLETEQVATKPGRTVRRWQRQGQLRESEAYSTETLILTVIARSFIYLLKISADFLHLDSK